ncbi:alpha/beta hydrolase [Verminephrobacter aporrectodeae]|uniref:alpha/beta hydrolase n=1 Tax=Verminephrobacter aporrectodeae TaxID=1110389 RepID=UPI00224486D3|nr:alpha/beta hydrolase-fold protein [Verminephrobacter aporrectodeae]
MLPPWTSRRRLLGTGLALCAPGAALAAAPAMSSPVPPLVGSPGVRLARTHRIDLAEAAGRPRRLFVALPQGPVPHRGHPVLWTLDGNALFPLMSALLWQRSARPADMRVALPVIVGLGHPGEAAYEQTARAEDYTPPPGPAAGQADRLLDCLAQLQAWLAHQLPINATQQTLFGHSFGGLLTLYALFSRPALFQRYFAASPSIWWGDRAILVHRDRFLQRPAGGGDDGRRLLLTAGSLEEGAAKPVADPGRERRQRERRQVGSARELVASLAGAPGLRAEFRLLDGQDHGSLVLPSSALALDLATAPT